MKIFLALKLFRHAYRQALAYVYSEDESVGTDEAR